MVHKRIQKSYINIIWSVVNYLGGRELKSYWENSVIGSIIDSKLLRNTIIKEKLESLILDRNLYLHDKTTDFYVNHFRPINAIMEKKNNVTEINEEGVNVFFSFLYVNGYLTNTLKKDHYAIPNNEIRKEILYRLLYYYAEILQIYSEKFNPFTLELNKIFSENDSEEISNILTTKFALELKALIDKLEIYSDDEKSVVVKRDLRKEDLMDTLLNIIGVKLVKADFANELYIQKTYRRKGKSYIILSKNGISVIIKMKYTQLYTNQEIAKNIFKEAALDQEKIYNNSIEKSKTKVFIGCNITVNKQVLLSGEIITADKSVKFNYSTTKE